MTPQAGVGYEMGHTFTVARAMSSLIFTRLLTLASAPRCSLNFSASPALRLLSQARLEAALP